MKMVYKQLFLLNFLIIFIRARSHYLEIRKDVRPIIKLSSFGYKDGGYMTLDVTKFEFDHSRFDHVYSLALIQADKNLNLQSSPVQNGNFIIAEPVVLFTLNFTEIIFSVHQSIKVKSSSSWRNEEIRDVLYSIDERENKAKDDSNRSDTSIQWNDVKLYVEGKYEDADGTTNYTSTFYSFQLEIRFNTRFDEGLYHLYFINSEFNELSQGVSFDMDLREVNYTSFLSSIDMPMPFVYTVMSVLFGVSGFLFVRTLRDRRGQLTKIHFLLGTLVFLKTLSLGLHAFYLYFTGKYDYFILLWECFFYAVVLIKNQLFFLTIAIIFKNFKLVLDTFKLIIPLQFVATFAEIICNKLERGSAHYLTFRDIFVVADIISCVLIVIPALSFGEKISSDPLHSKNLKHYRRFYLVFICYIVLTRLLAFTLNATAPYQLLWINKLLIEMFSFIFYTFAAYNFTPKKEEISYFSVEGSTVRSR